ncbi:uncharacterized protein [Choristoneura fumiferana]|uniref:uncharacterized protein n=1 Tax=Choristoneura fumiferana TaxID=7141 RepID=UPI003D15B101
MAVSGGVSIEQDGGVKLHPYLIALARWCVSCLWSTATAMLYRLLANPLPQITVGISKLNGASAASKPPPRAAGRDHLHPEPRVECAVLHQPALTHADVIFVHGLYGSLKNTWRQGEWRSKYKIEPNAISLRRPNSIPGCDCKQTDQNYSINEQNKDNIEYSDKVAVNIEQDDIDCINLKDNIKKENENILNFSDKEISFTNIDEYYKIKRITDNEVFITEKFYNDDEVEVMDSYETQAKFVRDLFARENLKDDKFEDLGCRCRADAKRSEDAGCTCRTDAKPCEVGCGCICDQCYSSCWPRDWIKVDYPNARVISINYTSDPHLWRPLWIKENKRLHLHERAEQMIEQLLALGVGERPIVWVGHSKGGLFIKQIYCEAYEAYKKLNGLNNEMKQNCDEYDKDNEINHETDGSNRIIDNIDVDSNTINNSKTINENDGNKIDETVDRENRVEENRNNFVDYNNEAKFNESCQNCNVFDNSFANSVGDSDSDASDDASGDSISLVSSIDEEEQRLRARARLWSKSSGFMFYSVPHRGSPLADIKTPITARSVELLEMGQDCSLVRRLHARWLAASARAAPRVRSLVETQRTLMAVLWLRIVSVDSADAGIGALCGVSLDHREICKPSSRRCILYTELKELIHAALKCRQ